MKKLLLTLLTVVMSVSAWAYTLPTSTMDLKTITARTMGTWQDASSYELSDNWLVVSAYASYKSVGTGKQTWITHTSAGNSASTWETLSGEPFKGSSYYTTASYTTIQKDRNIVYRVKNCKSVKVYGKNNSSSKYLQINIYEVTDGTAATSAAYTLSNTSTDEQVWSQALDGNKEYVVDIEGVGTSNSRVFEVAFERNVAVDNRQEPQLSLSATALDAYVGDTEFTEPIVTSAGGYTGSYEYSSNKPAVASVNATTGEVTIVAAGTATITVSVPEDDANYKPRSVSYTITVHKVAPTGAVFYESFDLFNGDGGNDDMWSNFTTTPALGTYDNTGWTTEGTNYAGFQCVSIRKNSDTTKPSGLTTPAIGVAGFGTVQFDAESWGTDGSYFFVDIVGGGTFTASTGITLSNSNTTARVELKKTGTWTTYNISFIGLTASSKFRFYAPANKRAFLDEVAVFVNGYTLPVADTDYYSLYLNYPVTIPSGITAYTGVLNAEETNLALTEITEKIPANTAVLVKATTAENYTFNKTTSEAFSGSNDLLGVNAQTALTDLAPSGKQVLTLGVDSEGVVAFRQPKNTYVGANKAYLLVDAPAQGAKTISLSFGEATGIESVQQNAQNSVAYNLAGQRVAADTKGIVIMNGKKYLNK